MRRAFEKALSYRPVLFDTVTDKSIPKVRFSVVKMSTYWCYSMWLELMCVHFFL